MYLAPALRKRLEFALYEVTGRRRTHLSSFDQRVHPRLEVGVQLHNGRIELQTEAVQLRRATCGGASQPWVGVAQRLRARAPCLYATPPLMPAVASSTSKMSTLSARSRCEGVAASESPRRASRCDRSELLFGCACCSAVATCQQCMRASGRRARYAHLRRSPPPAAGARALRRLRRCDARHWRRRARARAAGAKLNVHARGVKRRRRKGLKEPKR